MEKKIHPLNWIESKQNSVDLNGSKGLHLDHDKEAIKAENSKSLVMDSDFREADQRRHVSRDLTVRTTETETNPCAHSAQSSQLASRIKQLSSKHLGSSLGAALCTDPEETYQRLPLCALKPFHTASSTPGVMELTARAPTESMGFIV
ncbi:hypothetical protein HispidOSU_027438 [Sigmodon hispidus]